MLRIATLLLGFWLFLLLMTPLWLQSPMPILNHLGIGIYFFADPLCHQLSERSLFLKEAPLPVCVRCFSIYLAGFIVFLTACLRPVITVWPTRYYIRLMIPAAIEIVTEQVGLYHNIPVLRMVSGFLMGVVLFRIVLESLIKFKVRVTNE